MGQIIIQVDAFTDEPFCGNPAAVCILAEARDEQWMQAVALEMNLSETAFAVATDDGYDLRWFTPASEVDLCGHATLATAHVLWQEGHVAEDAECRFHTRSGLLTAVKRGSEIEVEFPAAEVTPDEDGEELTKALGVDGIFIGKTSLNYGLVEVASESAVRNVEPDFNALAALSCFGAIVTSLGEDPAIDFVSRFFAPALGVNEDPVTGSAHCALGPYWARRLNKKRLCAYQASARGGHVRVTVDGAKVCVGGGAVTVLRAELV